MLCETSATVPLWVTFVLAAVCGLLSIQLFRWCLETSEPPMYFDNPPLLRFVAEKDETQEGEEEER